MASVAAAGCDLRASEPPNLLLVTVDSLRADHLACYGGAARVGDRICGLGDQGIRYAWAFATASTSAPAIASLLTSRYPSDHGVRRDPATFLRSSSLSLVEELRRAGYLTAAVVSSPELNRSRNLHQGFASYDDRMSESEGAQHLTRPAAETTEAALAWMRAAEGPWFLWVHYRDLHGPYEEAGDLYAGVIPRADGPLGQALEKAIDRDLPVLDDESGRGGIPRSRAIQGLTRRSQYEAVYDAVLRRIDREIGRLIDELEAQETPFGVLLTADHGMAFGEDDRYLVHGHSLGLEQIRVPLLWRPPRFAVAREGAADSSSLPPRDVFEPVSTLAAAPTLLDAARIPTSETFPGGPLATHESEAVSDRIEPLFAEHPLRIALVSGSHYYARNRGARLMAAKGGVANEESRESASGETGVEASGEAEVLAGDLADIAEEEPLLDLAALARADARVAELWTRSSTEESDLDARRRASTQRLPPYEPARPSGIAPYLEPLLAEFLATRGDAPAPAANQPTE